MTNNQVIWFTSDWHVNHLNIIKYCNRPFQNIEEMNDILMKNYNKVVGENDIVYFLGDMFFGSKEYAKSYMLRLNIGVKILIKGNHDQWSNEFYRSVGFNDVHKKLEISYNDQRFLLHHYPLYDRKIPVDWLSEDRPAHKTMKQLCGHVHNAWKFKDDIYNIGVDVHNFKPVEMTEIIKAFEKEP